MTMALVDNYYACHNCGTKWADPAYRAGPDPCPQCREINQPTSTSEPYTP